MSSPFMPMPMAQPMSQPGATPWGNAAAPAPAANFGGFGAPASTHRAPQLNGGDGAPISFNPATFTEGGMIDNVWVRFSNGRASTFDYKGKSSAGASPAVIYDLQIVDAQTHQPLPGAAPQEKVWTVGKLEDFQPRANGVQFWSPSGKTGFNKSSNWAVFVRAAMQAGIPANVFDSGQVDALNGMVAFVQQVKTGGREGMRNTGGGGTGGTTREDGGTLVVTQIPGGARVDAAALGAGAGVAGQGGGAVAQPLMQAPQPMAQAQAPQPQQFAMPQAQPAPQVPTQFQAPQTFQPAAAPTTPMAPTAPAVDITAAQRVLAEVLQTNPTTKQAFNVALFQRTLTDEPLRNMVASPDFQRQMLGTPLNLA